MPADADILAAAKKYEEARNRHRQAQAVVAHLEERLHRAKAVEFEMMREANIATGELNAVCDGRQVEGRRAVEELAAMTEELRSFPEPATP